MHEAIVSTTFEKKIWSGFTTSMKLARKQITLALGFLPTTWIWQGFYNEYNSKVIDTLNKKIHCWYVTYLLQEMYYLTFHLIIRLCHIISKYLHPLFWVFKNISTVRRFIQRFNSCRKCDILHETLAVFQQQQNSSLDLLENIIM